jgi:hypothetical protein
MSATLHYLLSLLILTLICLSIPPNPHPQTHFMTLNPAKINDQLGSTWESVLGTSFSTPSPPGRRWSKQITRANKERETFKSVRKPFVL